MLSRILGPISISLLFLGAPACGGPPSPATEAAPARGPGDAYVAYVSAIGNADKLRELFPFVSSRQHPTDLNALKANVPGGALKIVAEKIDGEKATVTITGTQRDKDGKEQPATGTVQMVREEGRWKVDQESWSCCR